MKATIGGDRLGAGGKRKVETREFERSTHDIGYTWRSTMAPGTLVPFLCEVGLVGDTFDINLRTDVMTHPTIGPLFGSYKLQLDLFKIPIRLYQAKLHMNLQKIGLDMSKIKLPQVTINAAKPNAEKNIDNQQINPSSIFKYLGISGLGYPENPDDNYVNRWFNATSWLGYWDIYQNYYANLQEEQGMVIHNDLQVVTTDLAEGQLQTTGVPNPYITIPEYVTGDPIDSTTAYMNNTSKIVFNYTVDEIFDVDRLFFFQGTELKPAEELFVNWVWDPINQTLTGSGIPNGLSSRIVQVSYYVINRTIEDYNNLEPRLQAFPLENINDVKEKILMAASSSEPYRIFNNELPPFSYPLWSIQNEEEEIIARSILSPLEGLAVKTYQSDLFNNWLNEEWISGDNGINALTSIDTSSGSFTIDELNISKKVYEMMNRIAISGGTYYNWMEAVYNHKGVTVINAPTYEGGLSKEIVFQEVVSNAQTADQPLGTLAGRGVLGQKHKGGQATIKCDEMCYIMGIVSITPRVDYSQGNKWDVNLKTMDDFHKPDLDEIGFQDLITDQMAWWDTRVDNVYNEPKFRSAGKQPAWTNYMTNVNQVRGNFAEPTEQMFMTLNRKYENDWNSLGTNIGDLTTYIDPSKFNHIFADTRRDAQNFWVQIGIDITARRKMSARIMPNL